MYEEDTSHLFIEFWETEPIENKAESRKAGRPIFETKEMVKIRWVGDNKRVHNAPADEVAKRVMDQNGNFVGLSYKERWPKHYQAFKDQKAPPIDGTPLSELSVLTAVKVAELKALNIHTIESLAGLDTTGRKRLGMGAMELKQQAQAHLDIVKGEAVPMQLIAENEALKAQMEQLQSQMDALSGKTETSYGPTITRPSEPSPFDEMEDNDIKAFLKDRTGQAPRGRVSRETLIRMADDVIATEEAA